MFNDLKTDDTSIQSGGDNLGGSKFKTLDSGLYDMTIKLAYGSMSDKKARALNLVLVTEDGKELKAALYLTSNEEKGCLNYYMAKNPATGKKDLKKYLPGFELANHLCLMTLEKEISQISVENRTINLYDYTARKEVPTEVPMVTELLGKKITAGVIKRIVNKRAKNASTGKYEDIADTREENEIDKFFHFPSGLTVTEATGEIKEPKFKQMWAEKWTGQVDDRTNKDLKPAGTPGGNSGTFGGGGATEPSQATSGASLFGGAKAA